MRSHVPVPAWLLVVFFCLSILGGCITPDNEVLDGMGTPDVTQCSAIPGVEDGKDYRPRDAITLGTDNRAHPDVFYLGWAQLDMRSDLRFPEKGYDGTGYEDKLLVTRKTASPADANDPNAGNLTRTWQLLPHLDNNCQDVEKIRIHSFDVAPNGRSLYVSMARTALGETHLGIYRLDLETGDLAKISQESNVHYMYPTYIGNDPDTQHEMLVVAKTVTDADIPINYARATLQDEYDRSPTPLIHKMDAHTGDTVRIGFNNSHQTEPLAMTGPDGNRIVVFTQWEHQDSVNRFALWKMQIDGSDNFTFFGQESSSDRSSTHLFQPRAVRSGAYAGYTLMTESHNKFDAEGHIAMTFRHHQELRSDKHYLQQVKAVGATPTHLSRNPEHYNNESFVYSYRNNSNYTYQLYVKDFPATPGQAASDLPGSQLTPNTNDYHFVQARSYYPPERTPVAPSDAYDVGENRVSFTNENLQGKSGFLVQNLTQSDNGVQHQLDGIAPDDLSMQFFIPSHHFSNSQTVGLKTSAEMSIPASGFIKPEADGSMGVVMKNGLYVWKVNKRYRHQGQDIWIPVRAERQEVAFVPNRVNACNQCHQERNQANLDKYAEYDSIAAQKMHGTLTDVTDISSYNASYSVPDFHQDIMPLLTKPAAHGGQSCASCHSAGTKLDLSNTTGPEAMNATFRTLLRGARQLPDGRILPYSNDSINPLGMDDNYRPAPLLWSLVLGDDLTVPPDGTHANDSSRTLERTGDYGASYDEVIEQTIQGINGQYDHSQHWSAADIQEFITYSATQMPAGLSDRMTFTAQGNNYRWGAAGQKAYQAMVRNCFSCHNSFTGANGGGIEDAQFGLPLEKRFSSDTGQRDNRMRFMVHNHVANKLDTAYSKYTWQSHLENSRYNTLLSASYRINFANPEQSELLRYALGKDINGNPLTETQHKVRHPQVLIEQYADYQSLHAWVTGSNTLSQSPVQNAAPLLDTPPVPLTINEYDPPANLPNLLTWYDPDGANELSQLLLLGNNTSEHIFNDTMLGLAYSDFNSAALNAYAILGDRGTRQFAFKVTDGDASSTQYADVTVTSDYNVPAPSTVLPSAYAFYTVRDLGTNPDTAGELRKLEHDANNPDQPKDTLIGKIDGYNNNWTTLYRRADKGWLYFIEQESQIIHVVDETNAAILFHIRLNHEPNKETDIHKQTAYLLWWRPQEGLDHLSDNTNCPGGELQGLLESKLSRTRNGDFYIGLGCINPLAPAGETYTVIPRYRTKLLDGGNTLSVYTWRRATFMSKWVNEGVDRLNVLNLVTGKAKNLGDFDFPEQTITAADGMTFTTYPAATYNNVRAVVVADDGAFYGFNKDTNDQPVQIFNFDPLLEIQQPVATPAWLETYFTQYMNYGTPFLVIEPR